MYKYIVHASKAEFLARITLRDLIAGFLHAFFFSFFLVSFLLKHLANTIKISAPRHKGENQGFKMAAIELKARDAVAKAEATVGSAYFYTDLQQVTKDIQTQVMTTSSTGGPITQLSSSEVVASIENPAATSISSLVNSNITASTQGGINSSTALNQSRSSTPATGSVESILTDDLTGSIQIETSFSITGVSSSPVGTQSTKATSTGNSGAAPIRFTSGHHSCKFQMLLGVMLLLPILM